MTPPTLPNDLNQEIEALQRYRRALRREDQPIFDQLLGHIETHRLACQSADHLLSIEALLLTLLLEQQKQINRLKEQLGITEF
jgi:hypothetical protein